LIEDTGVFILIGRSKVLHAAVYKPPGRAWSDADVIELLNFRNRFSVADDLNAKNPVWNSSVSNLLGEKLLDLFNKHDFQIPAPQCPTHYTLQGNGDVLDTVVHRNV